MATSFVRGDDPVFGAEWQAAINSDNPGGSSSSSRAQTSEVAGRLSPRKTPPKKACRDVTASVLQGGQLDFSGITIPSFPVGESQDSVFTFAALGSQDASSFENPDGTNIAVPSSQDELLAAAANSSLTLAEPAEQGVPVAHVTHNTSVDPAVVSGVPNSSAASGDGSAAVDTTASTVSVSRLDVVSEEHDEQHRRTIIALVRSGSLVCPFCPRFSGTSAGGFIRHLSCKHHGEALHDDAVTVLRTLDRGFCVSPGCGAMRRFGVRHCSRCHTSSDIRPVRVGDLIPLPPDMRHMEESAQADEPMDAAVEEPVQDDSTVLLPDFLERVERLPASSTLVHTAFSQRISTCEFLASCLDGALDGGRVNNILAQSGPKLIFSMPPKGMNNTNEVKLRLNMWKESRYNDLLERIEAQFFERQQNRRKRRSGGQRTPMAEQGRRARNIAAEGAYNKAMASLGDGIAPLTVAEERSWSSTLLPTSTRPDRVLSAASNANRVTAAPFVPASSMYGTDAAEHPLKGVRFAPLTAPGPTGLRPEHVQEALLAKSRLVTNKLLRALDRLENACRRNCSSRDEMAYEIKTGLFEEKNGAKAATCTHR